MEVEKGVTAARCVGGAMGRRAFELLNCVVWIVYPIFFSKYFF